MIGPDGEARGLLRFATAPGSSSFLDFMSSAAAELLPGQRVEPDGSALTLRPRDGIRVRVRRR